MARPTSRTLTEGEQRIMEVLWKLEEASVQEVTDELAQYEPIAYTTALTMLRILTDKGHVQYRKEGKAHVYVPTLTREAARTTAIQQVIKRFFGGSPQALAQHLIREADVDIKEIEALDARVAKAKAKTRRTTR